MKLLFSLFALSFIVIMSFSRCTKTVTQTITDTVVVKDTVVRTLVVKPGPDDGQDGLVNSIPLYSGINLKGNPGFGAGEWTYNAQGYGEGTTRGYLEFVALDGLPDSAHIKSATLYLYGLPTAKDNAFLTGNSLYPGSPYSSYTDNSCWLKRVTANWDLDSITWNNMPTTTDINAATVPSTTSQWNNNDTVDVTKLVQDIVYSKQNYGFCLQLKNEQIYRCQGFAGSRCSDSTLWPKLVVTYSVY